MKRLFSAVLILIFLVGILSACGDTNAYRESYDLGVRYLDEGNYEESILAFTAAIEIDPKQAPAYVGRGDAYVKSGETTENLAAALADYEAALEVDDTHAAAFLDKLLVAVYEKLADVYLALGDTEAAKAILQQGFEATGDNKLSSVGEGLDEPKADLSGIERRDFDNGSYHIYQYDERGKEISLKAISSDGTVNWAETAEYDSQGWVVRVSREESTAKCDTTYDTNGRSVRKVESNSAMGGDVCTSEYTYAPQSTEVDIYISIEGRYPSQINVTYTMENENRSIELAGLSWGPDGIWSYTVLESSMYIEEHGRSRWTDLKTTDFRVDEAEK